MTSAIEKEDFDFESMKYRPEISFPSTPPQIPAHQMKKFMENNTLEGRTTSVPSADANHSTHTIDTYIRVKIPSDSLRKAKVEHWKEEHSAAKKWAWIDGSVAALAGAGLVAGAVFSAYTSPYVMMALGIISIVSTVFCAINISRASEASRQIEGWKASPLEKLANERAKAYQEGFPYVCRNDLKLQGSSHCKVLLPSEVRFLFERHFDSFCRNLLPQHPISEQGKKEWFDNFTRYNPVADEVLRYAHDGVIPTKYAQVSFDYEVLHKQLTNMRGEFIKLRHQRREETNKIIKEINQNRDLALLPFAGMLIYWKAAAKTDRDNKLSGTADLNKIKEIKEEYAAAVRKYEIYYIAAIIPVNLVFDNQVSNAKNTLKSILEEIKKNEASSHAPYFNYAWGLLNYAGQIKNQPDFVYPQQSLSPAQVFNIPVPSAPPAITINFIQQAQHQRPPGIGDSDYADYLRFVSAQQPAQNGTSLYPNLQAGG